MALTYIDCSVYRGPAANNDTSSYVALNPRHVPGSLVMAVSIATRESIGSQVACKLGIEHFVGGVLDYYDERALQSNEVKDGEEISLEVLEAAFKNANSLVYNFGHKLAAGGRMAASLLGFVLENSVIAVGKVGPGSVYLYRQGDLFPFFEKSIQPPSEIAHETYLGSNSMVSVELASVPAGESDILMAFPFNVSAEQEVELAKILNEGKFDRKNPSAYICRHIFPEFDKIPFVAYALIGPQTIYLAQAV